MSESVKDPPLAPKQNPDEVQESETPHVVNEQHKLSEDRNNTEDVVQEQSNTDTETEEEQLQPENTSTDSDLSDSSVGEGLRRRKPISDQDDQDIDTDDDKTTDQSKIGIASNGEKFIVPVTKNPLALYPIQQWDFWDWAKNSAGLCFALLLLPLPKSFFIFWFIFWRLGYNLGLGILLHKQSNGEWITKIYNKLAKKDSAYYPIIKKYLSIGMGADYNFDECPSSFNSWLAFRHIVDIILAFDLASYVVFCLAYLEFPSEFSFSLFVAYVTGALLCIFTVWAKTDAYRVVKDFAWYWGDFFYLINQKLTFDRVFSLSPHPMYTIGYSFFYGASLICQSYTVLYVSLFGHFCQLAFLSLVENPHIEKTYPTMVQNKDSEASKILYDLKTGYFRKDLIVFKNVDFFRSTDLFLVFILFYVLLLNLLNLHENFYIAQAIIWRCIHSFGLGFILHQQSKKQFWTNHFVKRGYTKQYAFENWKAILNLSIAITHVVFICCAVKMTTFAWNLSGPVLLKQTFGLILIALNIWSSVSTFEVLGDFGWFYGDFFIEEVPSTLYYSGIYRFINNPDSVTGFAGYYGLALLSDSWTIFFLAVLSQAANALFVRYVETPHMRKLYGSTVRDKSGIEQALSEIVNEAVEASPHLKKIKHKAEDLEKKAKRESKKLLEEFSKRANKIKETAKEKAKIAESNLKFRRTKSVNNFKFLD